MVAFVILYPGSWQAGYQLSSILAGGFDALASKLIPLEQITGGNR